MGVGDGVGGHGGHSLWTQADQSQNRTAAQKPLHGESQPLKPQLSYLQNQDLSIDFTALLYRKCLMNSGTWRCSGNGSCFRDSQQGT